MWTYSWIDISPDPGIGVVLGLIACAMLLVASVAALVGHWWTWRGWDAADHQADIRDQMECMRSLGVSPGVRYALAMRAGFKPETEHEKRWVAAMRETRRATEQAERLERRVSRLVARANAVLGRGR